MASNLLENFNIGGTEMSMTAMKKIKTMFFPKKMVGIDIGTASIKVVELSRWGQGKTLENYGQIQSVSLYKEPFRNIEKGSYLLSDYFVSKAVRAVLDEARIRTRAAIFSIPDFSTFCVSFDLPPMPARELKDAVYFNAPQHIPLPITETTLDWKLISGAPGDGKSALKIFLVAIPNQIVEQYKNVARLAGLELYAVEAESLALARSLAKNEQKCLCITDIGVQSTTINIIDKGKLKKSYSIDFAGGQLTYAVAKALGMGHAEAEQEKIAGGLISSKEGVGKTLYLLIDSLLVEIKKTISDFLQQEGRETEIIYLTGGTSALPGLKEYFQEILKKKVEIPNCFSDILYPPILDQTLEKLAPSFSVAAGAALGGLEI